MKRGWSAEEQTLYIDEVSIGEEVVEWEGRAIEDWEEDDLLDIDCGEGGWLIGYMDADDD